MPTMSEVLRKVTIQSTAPGANETADARPGRCRQDSRRRRILLRRDDDIFVPPHGEDRSFIERPYGGRESL